MTHIDISVDIKAEPADIFAFISDPANNPIWQGGMVSADVTSPGPLGVGSTYTQVAQMLGREIHSTFEIVAYEPGRLIKGTTVESSFPITFTRRVEPAAQPGYARVQAIVEGEASGFFKLFGPLFDRMVKNSVEGDYARLKALFEEKK